MGKVAAGMGVDKVVEDRVGLDIEVDKAVDVEEEDGIAEAARLVVRTGAPYRKRMRAEPE